MSLDQYVKDAMRRGRQDQNRLANTPDVMMAAVEYNGSMYFYPLQPNRMQAGPKMIPPPVDRAFSRYYIDGTDAIIVGTKIFSDEAKAAFDKISGRRRPVVAQQQPPAEVPPEA